MEILSSTILTKKLIEVKYLIKFIINIFSNNKLIDMVDTCTEGAFFIAKESLNACIPKYYYY